MVIWNKDADFNKSSLSLWNIVSKFLQLNLPCSRFSASALVRSRNLHIWWIKPQSIHHNFLIHWSNLHSPALSWAIKGEMRYFLAFVIIVMWKIIIFSDLIYFGIFYIYLISYILCILIYLQLNLRSSWYIWSCHIFFHETKNTWMLKSCFILFTVYEFIHVAI